MKGQQGNKRRKEFRNNRLLQIAFFFYLGMAPMFFSPLYPPKTTDKESKMDPTGCRHESGSASSKSK
jgi:hypothetical protein